jgi:hypothetical protein
MKNGLLITLLLVMGFCIGQNSERESLTLVNDSITRGNLTIDIDSRLSELINFSDKKDCPNLKLEPPRKLTPAEKCVNQNKIMGYKIQILYTKDREAAEKVKNDFARQNPGYTAELVYLAPDYRVLVGDYFTRKSAGPDLRKIQRTYPAAFTVQWRVWCRKAL